MGSSKRAFTTEQLLAVLPGTQAEVARALGRQPSDGTVRRRLNKLAKEAVAELVEGVWRRIRGLPELPDYRFPDHFDGPSETMFGEKVREYQVADVWEDADIELLERYVGASQRARLANAELGRDGLTTGGGQRRFVHPLVAVAREAERDAQVYENLLRERHEHAGGGDDEPDGDQAGL